MYNKIFTKILDSSIWLEPDATRLVWLTLIAAMDEDGFAQFASVPNLAHRAIVSLEAAQRAVEALEGPDQNSSDKDHDGRRIERVPGGWLVLNAEKYRLLVTRAVQREQTRERVRKHRSRNASPVTPALPPVTCNGSEAEAEAEANTEANTERARTAPRVTRGLAPLHDTSHRKHAICGRVCLPAPLFNDFVRRRNHDGADAEIRRWAADVLVAWTDGPHATTEPGDVFDFWKARYAEQWPPPATKSKAQRWAEGG